MSTRNLQQKSVLIAMSLLGASMAPGAFAADALSGKALYAERCGMCHQGIGMAVGILSRRPNDPSKGFLDQRTDLSAAVIRTVVRTGINNMPRISRAEVSNTELAAIADYLARGKP